MFEKIGKGLRIYNLFLQTSHWKGLLFDYTRFSRPGHLHESWPRILATDRTPGCNSGSSRRSREDTTSLTFNNLTAPFLISRSELGGALMRFLRGSSELLTNCNWSLAGSVNRKIDYQVSSNYIAMPCQG